MPPPLPPEGDPAVERFIGSLMECVCATLAAAGKAVCCCQWRRAERTLMPDACSCQCPDGQGVAWVRIAERRFDPLQQTRARSFSGGVCAVGVRQTLVMEAGVARCWPEGREGIDCDTMSNAAAEGAWDEQLLLQAVLCCEPLKPFGIVPVRARTLGPQGGCVAAVIEFTATTVSDLTPPYGGS